MVPVISEKNEVLFPCKERRARKLMERNEAKPHYRKGIFCIKLVRPHTEKREEYPQISLGIDPGSKREAYTAMTPKGVILNITSSTPDWIKDHLETRRNLRRARRYRKTPYRACRENRGVLRNAKRIPPSTKARWDAKLRIIKLLCSILPVSIINIEDIQARTLKGKKKWNTSFSPLEVGKKYFKEQIVALYPNIKFLKTSGKTTKQHRDQRGFAKSKSKLDYTWEAHNVDAHCLAELALQAPVKPYLGLYKLEFLQFHRRMLHRQNPAKGGVRSSYGSTISLGISRGSVALYQNKLCYVGGTSKGKISIHSIITGQRIKRNVNKSELKILYTTKWRTQFLPRLKPWVSLRKFRCLLILLD